jgi:hypothetical protein
MRAVAVEQLDDLANGLLVFVFILEVVDQRAADLVRLFAQLLAQVLEEKSVIF